MSAPGLRTLDLCLVSRCAHFQKSTLLLYSLELLLAACQPRSDDKSPTKLAVALYLSYGRESDIDLLI